MGTSTKVFFEKNGEPYNDSVTFAVTCYGYIVDNTDPNRKDFYKSSYARREPGTYNQTEVFSYSATADYYGDEIFEPFYINWRVMDYCTLCGETAGKTFYIENTGANPVPDCIRRANLVYFESDTDVCRLNTNETRECFKDQSELQAEKRESCDQYLEEFDMKNMYPYDTRTLEIGGVTMIVTPEYEACHEEADSIDFNCTSYMEEVECEDYCDPDGYPIERDCSLYYEIPADEYGNIIGAAPDSTEIVSGTEAVFMVDTGIEVEPEKSFDLLSVILEFLGLSN